LGELRGGESTDAEENASLRAGPPAAPVQLVMMRVPPQEMALLLAKVIWWTPVPRLMVEVELRVSVPTVSLLPVVAPVRKVPPARMRLVVSRIWLAAPRRTVAPPSTRNEVPATASTPAVFWSTSVPASTMVWPV
jgi:hypothetical protein